MTRLEDGFGHRWVRVRRRIQLAMFALWVALPVLGVVRVDLPRLRILVAGHAWPPLTAAALPTDALARGAAPRWDVILPAIAGTVLPVLLFVVAFVLLARNYGRVHCGFTCAYGAMAEHGERLFRWAREPGPYRAARLAAAYGLAVVAAPAVAFVIFSLFLGPEGLATGLVARDPIVLVPYVVFTAVTALMGAFVRLKFCRYVCGVGLVQTVAWVTKPKALEVGFNPSAAPALGRGSMRDCTGCHGCRDVCPIGFDPRTPKTSMLACFQCGLCLERCEEELFPLGKGPAIGFHLSDPEYPIVRPAANRPAAATAAALARRG